MRLIFGNETCAVCGKPGVYLIGSKPEGYQPEYFATFWLCKEHFKEFAKEL